MLLSAASILPAQTATYHVGDVVDVQWPGDNQWYRARVTDARDGKYFIVYEQDGLNAWYSPDRMRLIQAGGRPPAPAPASTPAPMAPAAGVPTYPPQAAPVLHAAAYKPGDRVEVDKASINSWEKGTVLPFLPSDPQDGSVYRVRLDVSSGVYAEGMPFQVKNIRPLAGAAPFDPGATVGPVTVDADGTLSADRPIQPCPVPQPQATNGDAPDPALLAKLIRCAKGEKPATKGSDGAVTIDIASLKVGAPRRWDPLADGGSGANADYTIVYPVEVTYTEKTFYRLRTIVNADWMRVINFYVNGSQQWQICSEVGVKDPKIFNVPR